MTRDELRDEIRELAARFGGDGLESDLFGLLVEVAKEYVDQIAEATPDPVGCALQGLAENLQPAPDHTV
jgi:hypothetical protein